MGSPRHDRAGAVRDLVTARLPGYRVDSVARIGVGLDNVAYEVNEDLVVRFSAESDPARRVARVDQEARLLAAVARVCPLPVPEPVFTVPAQGCLAYRKVPGVPLLDLPLAERTAHGSSIAATLGELLTALHAVPLERLADLVEPDDQPAAEWRAEAAQTYATVAVEVPAAHRPRVQAFLAAAPPAGGYGLVFSHNDLGIEHVLVDPAAWTVTGIIDWSDAALVDPAYDFGLVYRDLGPAALDAAVRSYRIDDHDLAALRARAAFYARCSVFEDLAYGLETGQHTYVDKCAAAMRWLFPA